MNDDQVCVEPLILQYAVEYYPNKAVVGLHFDVKIPDMSFLSSQKTEPGESLRNVLLGIEGVVEVNCYHQKLSITRGGAYQWPRIITQAVNVIRNYAKCDEAKEVALYA